MSVFRVEKNENYTVMGNYHLRDMGLSLKAIGLLSKILSLPEDWDYSLKGLVRICKDGQSAVDATLHELENQGYLVRTRDRSGDGRLTGTIYTIYEIPQKNPENPSMEKPNHENPEQEKHDQDNPNQLSKDITNIKKEPKTEETNKANERTTRAREAAVDELLSYVVEQIGRSLSSIERRIVVRWVDQETDLEMIRLALQDNLYRKEWFDVRHVQATLDEWKDKGIDNPKDAKNFILDRRVNKLSYVAAEIADETYDDNRAEKIMMRSEAADLQGTRDYIIDLFRQRRYDSALSVIKNTYHKEIIDYLPQEIVDYYEEHKNEE